MTDELDPDLRRLFAATADYPADEAFVAAVAARTPRRRPMLMQAVWGSVVLIALAIGLGLAASQVAALIEPLVNGSPFGWAVGLALALAGAACARVLGPLAARGRL